MVKFLINLIPFLIGCLIATITYFTIGWWGFWLIFLWIGCWISFGLFISSKKKGKGKDLGRRIAILNTALIFLIFLGIFQRENLQLEETVFYISAGMFSRVLIHYAVAKVFGPLIWGRGFCGWACWTAAILEWLPIKENRHIPQKYTKLRIITFVISIIIPLLFILSGYDYLQNHINEELGKFHQLIWFLIGNGIYYILAISLAFIFKKKRAFCKIICPVSLVMKVPASLAIIRQDSPTNKCIECGKCNENCPMDINVMEYAKAGKKITSTECILCGMCLNVCMPCKSN